MMILTSTPRLIYIDTKKMEEKGAIPIDGEFEIIIKVRRSCAHLWGCFARAI